MAFSARKRSSSPVAFPVSLAMALAILSVPVATDAQQRTTVTPDDQEAQGQDPLQHRYDEARSKAKRLERVLAMDATQTANQSLYDVHHYLLDLSITPGSQTYSGMTTISAEVIGPSLSTMELNLKSNLSVSAITSGGTGTTFSHISNLLTVNLDRVYVTGEFVEVVVTYSGNPGGASFVWTTDGGQPAVWTLSEPYGAREWWPCKDVNTDKADSVDVRITVPDNLTAVSNGALLSNIDNGSTRTFHWKSRYPIVTYLVSLAIHPYVFYNDWYTPQGGGDPMEVQFYVFASRFASVQTNYAQTVPMLDGFAQAFGEYPFVDEKYGHADFTFGGGMEHQTCTSMGGWSIGLIAHELGHQWWGDMITCADFSHIWLNEGFASWCEAYWQEISSGPEAYINNMFASAYYGPGTIIVENPSNVGNIFDTNLSYNKASWVVHMLRGALGDSLFFAGLAEYRSQFDGSSATTEQFRDAMEVASGQDLDAFFSQWIYGQYFPVYDYSWSQAGGTLDLTIDQLQSNTGLFTMPIQIRVTSTTGTQDFTVQNSLASENYMIAVTGTVQSVEFDPDNWILKQFDVTIENPTFNHGVLVVNGVDWGTYGSEITTAYDDSSFWGCFDIDFWDVFAEPVGGYPSVLPAAEGHGQIPPDILGRYSTVIWIGNDYNGDLPRWQLTPIQSYLDTGGNLLLMTRRGFNFLDVDLQNYLGVTPAELATTLSNYQASYPGLTSMSFIGSQSWNDVFLSGIPGTSTLLFQSSTGFPATRGLGVYTQPVGGGTQRPEGGHFVYMAGRPYRMNHAQLRGNIEFILTNLFSEPKTVVDVPVANVLVGRVQLLPNAPNPFGSETVISYSLPNPGKATIQIFDAAGRRIKTLLDGESPAGRGRLTWDGTDTNGRGLNSGVYYVRLEALGEASTRTIVIAR